MCSVGMTPAGGCRWPRGKTCGGPCSPSWRSCRARGTSSSSSFAATTRPRSARTPPSCGSGWPRQDGGMTPEELRAAGVTLVELSFVDNAGITRVKAVPLDLMPARPGASPCFDSFGSDDVMVAGRYVGGPDGDLRLEADMARAVALRGQPGWAW